MYYWEAPLPYRRVRLGQAVAASACVPALFDPIEFKGLFPDRSVCLVDGGVHDNQGIAGLLEQECTVILVSDASGQTNTEDHPSGESPAIALRANNVLMARVREAEFRELDLLRRSSALNGLAYLHLKNDLDVRHVDWVDCEDPYESLDEARPLQRRQALTHYGMPRTVQTRLASIRTDLDSFSDTEAYALMLSGYKMATTEFKACLPQWPLAASDREPWGFLAIEDTVTRAPGQEFEHARLLRLLEASAARGFKVWHLMPVLKAIVLVMLVIAGIGVGWSIARQWPQWWPFARLALLGITGVVSAGIVAWGAHRLCRTRKSITVIATGLLMVTVGWIAALVHLAVFDRLYLRIGKVRRRVTPPMESRAA
jgi:hypothetical protein